MTEVVDERLWLVAVLWMTKERRSRGREPRGWNRGGGRQGYFAIASIDI